MFFHKELSQEANAIKSVYDLIAICYNYLDINIDNQARFLATYIDVNEKIPHNPNIKRLVIFADKIKKILERGIISNDLFGMLNMEQLINLTMLTEQELVPFYVAEQNILTVPFFLLQGINLFLQDYPYIIKRPAPLNKYLANKYKIFINANQTMMDGIIAHKKYPKRILSSEIRLRFNMIIILTQEELPTWCKKLKVVTLSKDPKDIHNILKDKIVNIAIISLPKEKHFEFDLKVGSLFEITYDTDKESRLCNQIIKLLRKAIQEKANIIVLPEYVCGKQIQQAIQRELEIMNKTDGERLKHLLFVVAGSAWTEDSNNVSMIYSYTGQLMGKTYKHSFYDNLTKCGVKYIEGLANRGEEITLVRVPDIGITLIQICRDISEAGLSNNLAKTFSPQFLIVPAWSTSLDIAFKSQINEFICHNHKTCAVICNACAAVESKTQPRLGFVMVPQKNKSLIEGRSSYIETDKYCISCQNDSCLYMCHFDFSCEKERDEDVKIEICRINP